jgi:hypothetical protein
VVLPSYDDVIAAARRLVASDVVNVTVLGPAS